MELKDFKHGQVVWVEHIDKSVAQDNTQRCIQEWRVTVVGRKFIYAVKNSNRHYDDVCFAKDEKTGIWFEKNVIPKYRIYDSEEEALTIVKEQRSIFKTIYGKWVNDVDSKLYQRCSSDKLRKLYLKVCFDILKDSNLASEIK